MGRLLAFPHVPHCSYVLLSFPFRGSTQKAAERFFVDKIKILWYNAVDVKNCLAVIPQGYFAVMGIL